MYYEALIAEILSALLATDENNFFFSSSEFGSQNSACNCGVDLTCICGCGEAGEILLCSMIMKGFRRFCC